MTPNTEAWERIKEWAFRIVQEIKKYVRVLVNALKKLFITLCLQSDKLRPRALIYLRTKNRRIKRKQFKWLIREFGGVAP